MREVIRIYLLIRIILALFCEELSPAFISSSLSYFRIYLLFFPLHCSLFSPLSLSLFYPTLSHCIAPVSRLPARQCGPGGSNQLNYWEHKNAAANGSWINTLAKLLPRLPPLPQGIKLKILRLRTQRLEATAEAFVWGWATAMTQAGPMHGVPECRGMNLIMSLQSQSGGRWMGVFLYSLINSLSQFDWEWVIVRFYWYQCP